RGGRARAESHRINQDQSGSIRTIARKASCMTSLERRLLAASLLLGVLTLSVITGRALFAAPHVAAVSGNFYGANEAYMLAGAVDWPPANSNWAAVPSNELVANYPYQMQSGQSYSPFHAGGQQQIAADLNSAAS